VKLEDMPTSLRCLVTGSSGYIGGRLVPGLLAAGHQVRCMARDPGKLGDRSWTGDVEIARADVTDAAAVRRALQDVDVAYYLIHSLGAGPSFEQKDRDAARPAGTPSRWPGPCGGWWTGWPAGSGCAAAAATPGTCCPATHWTSGGSKRSRPGPCSGCAPR
jgi:hypothetical protein